MEFYAIKQGRKTGKNNKILHLAAYNSKVQMN